jgi:hypothetical protein
MRTNNNLKAENSKLRAVCAELHEAKGLLDLSKRSATWTSRRSEWARDLHSTA